MRLYLFRTGTLVATGAPIACYLIQTDDGVNVLVDTGYPRARAGRYAPGSPEPIRVEAGEDVVSRLAEVGLAPQDVHMVVCSHLDPDHAGNHDAFPDAEFVIQREHHELALSGTVPRLEMTRSAWDRPELKYRRVEGDTELLRGIDLLETSGHIAGHQSLLVRLPDTGPVLLAVDAIPERAARDAETRPMYPFDQDEPATRAATARLMDLAEATGALVVHGHCAEQWPELTTGPAYYS
ncbi:N-acyl homoserine lactonase family protein [Spirillospora sp. NPDC052242]